MRILTLLSLCCLITWSSCDSPTSSPSSSDAGANLNETRSDQRGDVWKVETRSTGWTSWSEWSTCSRSCDGGVSHQLRRCTSQAGCKGEPVRYKICNMQPCPESREFRDSQCSAFDNVPYEGSLFHWTPHYDDSDPCSLTCRGRPRNSAPELNSIGNSIISNSIGVEKDITNSLSSDSTNGNINNVRNLSSDEDEDSTDAGGEEEDDDGSKLNQENQHMDDEALVVVARLSDRVHDGTRCRPGSLDMCIDGKCRRVGCDLRIGSTKKVDACGVCGGDGTSCAQPLYHWTIAPMSLCSVTCGGGYKMSRPVCQNRVSGAEVEEQLCNAAQKPDATVVKCNTHKCPPKWVAGEWGTCSVSCGGGSRLRQVQCVEEVNNTRNKVNEHNCRGHKPRYQEPCNQIDCPKWRTSPWSGCSVSCGEGVQVRGVECRDNRDLQSVLCEDYAKPSTTQPCSTGIACPAPPDEDDHLDELLPGLYHTQPLLQPYPPDPPPPPAHAERLIGEQVAPSVTTFIADEWGPCSVTCGKGIRTREVQCKIFLEISRTIAKLPDAHCPGPKPEERETCLMEPCTMPNVIIDTVRDGYMDGMYPDTYRSLTNYESSSSDRSSSSAQGKTYSWKEQGFTECSASCLGGLQEMIINCIRDDNQRVTSPYMCSPDTKPPPIVRTCNEHACPPRWNYSDFQPCTKSCGFGIQTREVNCIHEVSQGGGGNTVVIPNHMCPQPPPPDRQYCNVLDCPVKWHTTEWSKCSKSCGGGIKERKVECKQVMAQNHVVDRPESMCPSSKPQERRPCNTKSCVLESDKPEIVVSNSSFIQHDVKRKRITVKIGGSATVFYGTMIKIKCHVKRYNRTKIQWAKDHNYLSKSKKYKISKKGALRIQNLAYSDSGVYTCMAGKSSADLSLTVKPKPGEFPSSEEIERHNQNRIDRNRHGETSEALGSRNDGYHRPLVIGDDHSHEQRPGEGPQPLPKAQTGRNRNSFRPTMPPIMSHGEGGGKNSNKDKGKLEKSNTNTPQHSSTTSGIDHDQDGALPSQLPASIGSHRPPLTAEVPSSGASRIMPHFQQLLANLQTFSNSRGHRMVAFPPEMGDIPPALDPLHHLYEDIQKSFSSKPYSDSLHLDEEDILKLSSSTSASISGVSDLPSLSDYDIKHEDLFEDVTDDDLNLDGDSFNGMGRAVILGKGSADALKFEWSIMDWSKCSQSCGGNGFQRRAAHCMVRLHNTTQDVDATLCEDAGLATPPTIRKCGIDECPQWITTEWTPCKESRCFNWNTAIQRRNVTCLSQPELGNLKQCNEKHRPPHKQECYNEKCKGTWKVGEWSDCAAACEAQGVKYRTLQCVWYGTKRPAGTACSEQSRPAIMKKCKGPPCPKGWWNNCKDHSKFCPNVKIMNLCRIQRFEQQCCHTCRIKG